MNKTSISYTYWQDVNIWLGYLDNYPDYMTQGASMKELQENLMDIHKELESGYIPAVRRHGHLELV